MKRVHQVVLIISAELLSWLGMMIVHEFGHVVGAWLTGGTVAKVVLHPLTISRTDLSYNPHPLIVVWAGPVLGISLPLAAWGGAVLLRLPGRYLLRFFAEFCLIANGAYIGVGEFDRIGDAGDMLRHGAARWHLWFFGMVTAPLGLFLWHNQGKYFGLGKSRGFVSERAAYGCLILLVGVVAAEWVAACGFASTHKPQAARTMFPMFCIVYSPRYNIGFFGLERLHPFDARKYGRAYRELQKQFGARLRSLTVYPPRPVNREELLAVHAESYLNSLRDPDVVARALELGLLRNLTAWLIDWCVLRPMRWATQGTVVAAREAMRVGLAVNLGGGYHHAKPAGGEGFCVYADVALAVHKLREEGLLSEEDRVAHIDLDAHLGNGVAYCFKNDVRVFLFDIFNQAIYPANDRAALDRVDLPVPLRPRCDGASYLRFLREDMPPFLDSVGRSGLLKLAVYNAGTDVYEGDPLGRLGLSAAQVLERDLFVIDLLRQHDIPTVMVPSGGYHRDSYRLVAETVKHLIERYAKG